MVKADGVLQKGARMRVTSLLVAILFLASLSGCAPSVESPQIQELEARVKSLEAELERYKQVLAPPEAGDPAQEIDLRDHHIMVLHDLEMAADVVAEQERKNCRQVCDFYCCKWGPAPESPGTAKCLAYNQRCEWEC